MWFISLLCLLARTATAVQPGASPPVLSPLRSLTWGDLNFLHTTDTHGWHGGHLQEPSFAGDWGDYVSLSERLHDRADQDGVDLLLVDTGDRVEGNGLYDASNPKGKYTYDIFAQQDIDIITSGNHELYKANTSEAEFLTMVPSFQGTYISSNIEIYDPTTGRLVPLAPRKYRKFTTKNRGYNVLAFGFLFDFTANAGNTVVTRVEDTVEQDWFREALNDDSLDIIIVIGHVDIRSPEYEAVYHAIRKVHPNLPLQFFGGHTHVRDFKVYDSTSTALESGRYMETIGWLSIDGLGSPKARKTSKGHVRRESQSLQFSRRYIDNNLHSFAFHANTTVDSFPTERGRNTTRMITAARSALGLDEVIGCIPRDLYLLRAPADSPNSVLRWVKESVLPTQLSYSHRGQMEKPALALFNTGAIRFDIFRGTYTTDSSYMVSPFTSGFNYIPDVPASIVVRVLEILNQMSRIVVSSMAGPVFAESEELVATLKRVIGGNVNMLVPPQQLAMAHSERIRIASGVAGSKVTAASTGASNQRPLTADGHGLEHPKGKIIPGYTTVDDAGTDGDDTLHRVIDYYEVPAVMMSEVQYDLANGDGDDLVDLVYIDFIQPFVLLALKLARFPVDKADVGVYDNRYLGGLIVDHVRQTWPAVGGKCLR